MFEFRRGVAFRVDVGDFLELERALQSNGVQRSSAQKQSVVLVREDLGQRLNGGIQLQSLLDQTGQLQQLRDEVTLLARGCTVLCHSNRQHPQRDQLRG